MRSPTCALCGRDRLPDRSTLSRFLAALPQEPVEALRTLFLDDLLLRPLSPERQTGDLVDRVGEAQVVCDIDGTREAARQRALPRQSTPTCFPPVGCLLRSRLSGVQARESRPDLRRRQPLMRSSDRAEAIGY